MNDPILFHCATTNLGNCGEWSHPNKIRHFLQSIERDLAYPHLIALQEIGAEASQENPTLRAIIGDQIAIQLNETIADPTLHYQYSEIAPRPNSTGGEPSLNIRCGFLHRAPLSVHHLEAIGQNLPPFTGDSTLDPPYQPSRSPLALFATFYGNPILIINCHLKSMNARSRDEERAAKAQRNAQMECILHYTQQYANYPTLIMGDFNDTPGSDTLKIALTDQIFQPIYCYTSRSTYTYRHRNRPLVLDYILYNSSLQLEAFQIIHLNTNLANQNRYSDHDPVLATFTL